MVTTLSTLPDSVHPYLDRDMAVRKINRWACQNQAFVFLIDYEVRNFYLHRLNHPVISPFYYDFQGFRNYQPVGPVKHFHFSKKPVGYFSYKKAFNKVIKEIRNGQTYLLNLTFPTPINTNLSLEEIFLRSQAKYKIYVPGKFVVFSPETFIRIRNNRIYSYPMKGTSDYSEDPEGKIIMADPKEKAEHATIVDLIRNDLASIAKRVSVDRYRYLDLIQTHETRLWQVSSEISGDLAPNWREELGDLICAILPAGSVTGAPKRKTLEIIRETEIQNRGFYTGICGYFDGNNLDCGVMIRFIEKGENSLIYRSGGGITSQSHCFPEYQEYLNKIYVPIF